MGGRIRTWLPLLGVAVGMILDAGAQESIDGSRRNAIVQAIEKASPAVVSVNVVDVQTRREFSDFWDLFEPFPRRPQYRVKRTRIDSVGSGFVFDDRGHILTNYHVVKDFITPPNKVQSVTLGDGRRFDVDFVGADTRTDVAVLRIKSGEAPSAALGDSDDLLIGEWVIAIGNPFSGLMADAQPTVSVGVVSANHRRISRGIGGGERLYQDMIQTDAAINPGNSGGPLVDARGRVVGINTMIFSKSGGSIGLGFVIPINRARRVADEIIRYGRRRDPWAGFMVEDVGQLYDDFRRKLELRADTGCLIVEILKESPAFEAGLRLGDVVVSINDTLVHTASDIDFVMWGLFVDDSIEILVDRRGERIPIRFTVKELNR